jgi:hypothetical protein
MAEPPIALIVLLLDRGEMVDQRENAKANILLDVLLPEVDVFVSHA